MHLTSVYLLARENGQQAVGDIFSACFVDGCHILLFSLYWEVSSQFGKYHTIGQAQQVLEDVCQKQSGLGV